MRPLLSWLRTLTLLGVMVALVATATPAQAGGDVDWSQYIEDKPTRALKSQSPPVVQKGKAQRAKKAVAKKSSAKARKATRGAKGKKARRR